MPHDQLSQLLAGIEHAGLTGGGRGARDERAKLDRLLLVVHKTENLESSQVVTAARPSNHMLQDPLNIDLQFGVPLRTGRTLAGVDPLDDMRMVGRWGDRQHL